VSRKQRQQQKQHPERARQRQRVQDAHWSETAGGVLAHATKLEEQYSHTDLIVVGVRKDGKVDILPYAHDRYRLLGILRWVTDQISKGPSHG
jgi:hypothetical protein